MGEASDNHPLPRALHAVGTPSPGATNGDALPRTVSPQLGGEGPSTSTLRLVSDVLRSESTDSPKSTAAPVFEPILCDALPPPPSASPSSGDLPAVAPVLSSVSPALEASCSKDAMDVDCVLPQSINYGGK
jgi:hypothetical protein